MKRIFEVLADLAPTCLLIAFTAGFVIGFALAEVFEKRHDHVLKITTFCL